VARRLGEPSVVVWMTAHAWCMGSGLAALATYLPLYAYEQLEVDAALAGLPSGILAVTAMGSRLAWGIASDRIARLSTVLVLIAALSTASVLLVASASEVGFWLLCVGGFAIGATASAWNALATLEVMRRVGSSQAGRASGILFTGFFAGWLVAPVSAGWIVDVTRTYTVVWFAVMGLFACAAATAWEWHRRSVRPAASARRAQEIL
jgi:MFS family permease